MNHQNNIIGEPVYIWEGGGSVLQATTFKRYVYSDISVKNTI